MNSKGSNANAGCIAMEVPLSQSLITYTGFDHSLLVKLHDLFKDAYYSFTPYSDDRRIALVAKTQGRGRLFSSVAAFGLVLSYFRSRSLCSYLSFSLVHHRCLDDSFFAGTLSWL